MRNHIKMKDAAGANFHDDEHIDRAESCRHNNQEIACNDGFRIFGERKEGHLSSLPIGAVEGAVLDGFGHMLGLDLLARFEIRNRA